VAVALRNIHTFKSYTRGKASALAMYGYLATGFTLPFATAWRLSQKPDPSIAFRPAAHPVPFAYVKRH